MYIIKKIKFLLLFSLSLSVLLSCRNTENKFVETEKSQDPQYIYLQEGNAKYIGTKVLFTSQDAIMGYDSVFQVLKEIFIQYPSAKKGIKFSRILSEDTTGTWIEMGIFCPNPPLLNTPYYVDSLPKGYYASATVLGAFHQIPMSQDLLEQQLKKDKVPYHRQLEELYYVDIDSTKEVGNWVTEIRYPVKLKND